MTMIHPVSKDRADGGLWEKPETDIFLAHVKTYLHMSLNSLVHLKTHIHTYIHTLTTLFVLFFGYKKYFSREEKLNIDMDNT